ncbi:dsDNA nuclease domain-containing protein [Sutcliffiella horikoshii]|uniref:dsDNA nuclease domain-containing protein n=1 Tax=Sutcliffiella horikoshii TaxID=79883 RepID=UPI003CF370BB
MSISHYYMNLPFDLAGSRAKNRFRNEILWGLKKILELFKEDAEFTVVFDYSCDVEVHKEDRFEFYQLKTQQDGTTYTVSKLLNRNSSGDSVFGKLYKLKFSPDGIEVDKTKIALVSNAPLNDNKSVHRDIEILELKTIDPAAVDDIKKNMKEELNLETDINLENSNFERTSMDLIYPDKTLIGELADFFHDYFQSEPKKINMLFRMLKGEIERKATYELKVLEYDVLLEKKGVSKSYMKHFLYNYIENTDIAVEKVKIYIDTTYQDIFRKRYKLNTALSNIVGQLNSNNKHLQKMEAEIYSYILMHLDQLPEKDEEVIDVIIDNFHSMKTVETSNEDLHVLILLVMKKMEEGVYNQ